MNVTARMGERDRDLAADAGRMVIESIECFTVTIPIEAPILTSYGSLGAYSRSIIRIRASNGLVGYGDTNARVSSEAIRFFEPVIRGMNPWETTTIVRRIRNWNYYHYQRAEPLIAGIEMACLDLQGKAVGLPLYKLLGGSVHDSVPVAGYIFFRHANPEGEGEVHSIEDVVDYARKVVSRYGFRTLKLKGGYFSPEHDLEAMIALRETFGRDMRLRIDPQGAWTPATGVRIGRELDRIGIEYYEDPVWGAGSMAQVKRGVSSPLATNMCVTNFDELYPAFRMGAVDVILSDLWYWGGIKACLALERTCSTIGLDVGMHSGTELAIGWAAMVHTAAAMPNLRLAMDYMNMHLRDDLAVGERLMPVDGQVTPPEAPGLGVTVDEEKLKHYAELAKSGRASDRLVNPGVADVARPGWFPQMPAW